MTTTNTAIKRALCAFLVLTLGSPWASPWAKGENPENSPHTQYSEIEQNILNLEKREEDLHFQSISSVSAALAIPVMYAMSGLLSSASSAAAFPKQLPGSQFFVAAASLFMLFRGGKKFLEVEVMKSHVLRVYVRSNTITFWNHLADEGLKCLVEHSQDSQSSSFSDNEDGILLFSTEVFRRLNNTLDIKYDTCSAITALD